MYGKHFASMYEGSMVGAGAVAFAVLGYIIAKSEPDRIVGTQVELNPKLLALILGESEQAIRAVIEKFCSPDPSSRSTEEQGRKLVKVGTFSYKVVNGAKYRAIRDEEERRRQNREAQARYRTKLKKPDPEQARIDKFTKAESEGNFNEADRVVAPEYGKDSMPTPGTTPPDQF
jgi:hypothetical protein